MEQCYSRIITIYFESKGPYYVSPVVLSALRERDSSVTHSQHQATHLLSLRTSGDPSSEQRERSCRRSTRVELWAVLWAEPEETGAAGVEESLP